MLAAARLPQPHDGGSDQKYSCYESWHRVQLHYGCGFVLLVRIDAAAFTLCNTWFSMVASLERDDVGVTGCDQKYAYCCWWCGVQPLCAAFQDYAAFVLWDRWFGTVASLEKNLV